MASLKFIFSLLAVTILIASTSSLPVIVQHGKICTDQVIGHYIDAFGRRAPVYRRVCRKIIPAALGDTVDDEIENDLNDENNSKDESTEQLRRAILSKVQ